MLSRVQKGEDAGMLDHPIIGVALGLIFFYVVLSLVASAVKEWIASLLGLRSKNLYEGVKTLIGNDFARKVYEHPLIKNLAKANKLPSYIDPGTMSTVLLEVIAKDYKGKSYVSCAADEVRDMIGKIDNVHPLKGVLEALVDGSDEAADALKERFAGWFDEGMTRVAGWYKRKAKLIIILIAAGLTVITNASSIHIAEELWRNSALRTSIAIQAEAFANQEAAKLPESDLEQLVETFPIGWDATPESTPGWLVTILGWIITIAAVSLGAPFWFDLLSRVANLRASGGQAQVSKAGHSPTTSST